MAISEAEKIRRAEELYYKRRYNQDYRSIKEKNKKSFWGWVVGKIIYIGLIVICIWSYNNRDYLLSEDFKNDFNTFINKQINIKEAFENMYMNKEDENDASQENNIEVELETVDSIDNVVTLAKTNLQKTVYTSESTKTVSDFETISQYIKYACEFKVPLKKIVSITSRYGYRTSSHKNVTGYHTGIDLAAPSGTAIYSAISGTIIEVSTEGNYGKHLKIASTYDENIITLYAHCSKIVKEEGDVVEVGEKIAEVGSTGNATGPHLHFEIRYKDEFVNPESVMEF